MIKILWLEVVVLIESYKVVLFFSWTIFHIEGAARVTEKWTLNLIRRKILKKYTIMYVTDGYLIFYCRPSSSLGTTAESFSFFFKFVELFLENHWTDNQK